MGATETTTAPARELAGGDTDALRLEGVTRSWGRTPVLRGASLRIAPGTTAWLGGANGAGKTTLLRIAAGMILPQAGSVRLAGLDPIGDRREYQRRLGYLSAGDRGIYARLTVRQNLNYWAGLALVAPRRRAELLDAALARFELSELGRRRVDRLSMGQRQRVRLAAAFLHEPRVVMLDEPHTSLDDEALELVERAMDELKARGGSVLWCSPAHRQLPLPADASYHLRDGVIVPV